MAQQVATAQTVGAILKPQLGLEGSAEELRGSVGGALQNLHAEVLHR